MSRFFSRAFRAAKLDVSLFEEVMADAKAMTQSIIVVFIYGAAVAYGSFGRAGVAGINSAIIITLIGWYIWAFSTYFAGARLFPETGITDDRKAFMRAMGFASAPGILRILGFIPGFGILVVLVATGWMIAAATIGAKLALNYESTYRALGVCIIGMIISAVFQMIMFIMLFSAFGVTAR